MSTFKFVSDKLNEAHALFPEVLRLPLVCRLYAIIQECRQAIRDEDNEDRALTQTVTWIPVGERLPDILGSYHVALEDGCTQLLWFGMRGFPRSAKGVRLRVTHWAEPLKHPNQLTEEQNER